MGKIGASLVLRNFETRFLQWQVQHPEYGEPFIGNTNAGEVPGVGASGKPGETPYLEVSYNPRETHWFFDHL